MSSEAPRSNIDFREAVHLASFAVVITSFENGEQPIVYVNPAFTVLTRYLPEEVLGLNCRFLQGPGTDPATIAEIRRALRDGEPICRDLLNYRKDHEAFWNRLTLSPRHDNCGQLIGFMGILVDLSEFRTLQDAKVRAEVLVEGIASAVPGYLFQRIMKPDGSLEFPFLSQGFASLLQLPASRKVSALDVQRYVHPDDLLGFDTAIKRSAANMTRLTVEFRVITAEGGQRWLRTTSNPRRLGADVIWDGIAIDVTAEKDAEERLTFLAYNDPLTGLPNRSLLELSLQDAVSEAKEPAHLALFHVDIIGLQEINDIAGRGAGDAVLQSTASALAASYSQTGMIVARNGGDEFAAMLIGVETAEKAASIASAMIACLSRPVLYRGENIEVRVCVGFTIGGGQVELPPGDKLATELMRQADIALAAAKTKGPGHFSAYETSTDDRVRHRLMLKQSLHRALAQQQFELHYHPLVDLSSGRIVGAEALIRWRHPDLGMQRPDVFIPIAEESGLIVPLGEWVTREAMRQVGDWRREGLQPPRIAINVSSRQIQQSDFASTLERALEEFGREASEFELELTEGLLIGRSPESVASLHNIKALGFDLAVDDFGTGYSSLQYLHNFPVDKIKIDQSFIRRMVVDSSDASIIRAIIAMARSLKLDVVAEGIETTMQRDFLRDEGCRVGQGYLFSLPLVAEDFGWLLRQGSLLPLGKQQPQKQRRHGKARARQTA